jgi:hypothetical protein
MDLVWGERDTVEQTVQTLEELLQIDREISANDQPNSQR